jgi:hypothetical protein
MNLSAEVHNFAEQLRDLYDQYFSLLVKAVSRQLIVASYQICTQKYPESFLNLNYNARVKLQEKLKSIGYSFTEKLGEDLSKIEIDNPELAHNFQEVFFKLTNSEMRAKLTTETEITPENVRERNNQDNSNDLLLFNPQDLLQLAADIENCLEDNLNELSRLANNCLQEAAILPRQIPAKILEMALQAEESSTISNSPPNLLNLLVEKENNTGQEEPNITAITAICLRVSEIEFTEASLNNYRTKIRNLMAKIEQISDTYRRKTKEYAIAEAEFAWRASWYESHQ